MMLSGFSGDLDVWTVLNDISEEGSFTSQPYAAIPQTWTNWGSNQPDGGRDENCVAVDGDDFTWRDDPCDAKHLPLCILIPSINYDF